MRTLRTLETALDSDYLQRVLRSEANDYSQDDEPENWKTELIFKIAVKTLRIFHGDVYFQTLMDLVTEELSDLGYENLMSQAHGELELIWETI